MGNKKTALAILLGVMSIIAVAGIDVVQAQGPPPLDWTKLEIKITTPPSGTVDLPEGQILTIEGTLTYEGKAATSANAVTIMSEGKIIGVGTNILDGKWKARMQWSWFVSSVGTGVHEYYAIWTYAYGDLLYYDDSVVGAYSSGGVSTWLSQGHTFYVNVIPAVIRYTLTTHVQPVGGGSVSPPGGTYDNGTTIDVVALPASGYYFSGWSGDASGTSAHISLTMNSNKDITANFTSIPPTYTLTTHVDPEGAGTVSPPGGTFPSGTVVSVSANPNSGWTFDRWSGSASGTSQTITIIMDSNKEITAHFIGGPIPEYCNLTTYVVEGNGSVSPSGTNTYPKDTQVTITATPDTGWLFDHWSVDLTSSQNPATVTMNSNKTVGAHFKQIVPENMVLTMISTPPQGGTIQATVLAQTTATFTKGATVMVTAFPNQGWEFDYWAGDVVGNSPTTTIKMDSNKTAIAVFTEEKAWWEEYQMYIIAGILAAIIVVAAVVIARRK